MRCKHCALGCAIGLTFQPSAPDFIPIYNQTASNGNLTDILHWMAFKPAFSQSTVQLYDTDQLFSEPACTGAAAGDAAGGVVVVELLPGCGPVPYGLSPGGYMGIAGGRASAAVGLYCGVADEWMLPRKSSRVCLASMPRKGLLFEHPLCDK